MFGLLSLLTNSILCFTNIYFLYE